jgi:hypothetical protein
MDQFEHVMVLLSIVVGLGIAHILVGIGGLIDRISGGSDPIRLSVAHAAWSGYVLVWLALFWWWEYRLDALIEVWSIGVYFFVLAYAVVLFLLAVTLVPRSWAGVGDLNTYFLRKRYWFFSFLLLANLMDIGDSYAKGGWEYVGETGFWGIGFVLVTIPVAVLGMWSQSRTLHAAIAVIFLVVQILVGFEGMPELGGLPGVGR